MKPARTPRSSGLDRLIRTDLVDSPDWTCRLCLLAGARERGMGVTAREEGKRQKGKRGQEEEEKGGEGRDS